MFERHLELLLDDLQKFHGAGLDTDAAGDALGSVSSTFRHDHNLKGAGLDALAAANALFLIDHVNAGLGVLGDGFMFAGAHALAALDAVIHLGFAVLFHDLDAAQARIGYLIKCFGASHNAAKACHAAIVLADIQLLHLSTSM